MNPYLEQDDVWHSFHQQFCSVCQELLVPQVRPGYIVKLEEHVYIHERESFIEIRDRKTRELITVIELLSPSNKKAGSDREQYLAKRRQLLASPSHFVEIDLLRGGSQMPVEDLPGCDYYALVSRAEDRPQVGIWPVGIRDPLPDIPIPLRTPDADAHIDLRSIRDRVYDAAGYEDYVYGSLPQPSLRTEDASWAEQFAPVQQPSV
jgi:hypothetical protein